MNVEKESRSLMVRLAIIGCGAVTELYHLPAARLVPEIQIAALVDRNLARAQSLGKEFRVDVCIDDYRQLPGNVDGVINALPHHMHAPVTIEFLERRVPILVEKPMALNLKEAEAMVKAAKDNRVALQVGLMNRFCKGAHAVKRAVDENWLGRLRSFSVEWGFVYDWPVASSFFFSKDLAGGGVLLDLGSHVLDSLLWWIGPVKDVEYRDDSQGGVEAECWMSLVLQGPHGSVEGSVTLSRLRKLTRTAQIIGERFTIECDIGNPSIARLRQGSPDGEGVVFALETDSIPNQRFAEQLRAFARVITTGCAPAVPGDQALSSMALIDRCYRERHPLRYPWERQMAQAHSR
jgi:predicted dehydrogenase